MILCYHGVTERADDDPVDRSAILVKRQLFESHMKYLKRYYTVISLREYLTARVQNKPLPLHSVVLTFDDGLRNFLTVAAPTLRELDLPATIFLITDRVERRESSSGADTWSPADDRVSLSWSEVRALQATQEVDFGSHTCSHPEFSDMLANSRFRRELHDSLDVISRNVPNAFPLSLAYPYGEYSPAIIAEARALGYSCGLTTDAGSNSAVTPLFCFRRAVVRRFDTIPVFAARVSGLVGWMRLGRDAMRECRISSIPFGRNVVAPKSAQPAS
jgi:peptidoglycan/xylan/chitin deacetylase (PgdA/CDA1 family)